MSEVTIRPMRPADGDAVLALYQAGLDGGNAGLLAAVPPGRGWPTFVPDANLHQLEAR